MGSYENVFGIAEVPALIHCSLSNDSDRLAISTVLFSAVSGKYKRGHISLSRKLQRSKTFLPFLYQTRTFLGAGLDLLRHLVMPEPGINDGDLHQAGDTHRQKRRTPPIQQEGLGALSGSVHEQYQWDYRGEITGEQDPDEGNGSQSPFRIPGLYLLTNVRADLEMSTRTVNCSVYEGRDSGDG